MKTPVFHSPFRYVHESYRSHKSYRSYGTYRTYGNITRLLLSRLGRLFEVEAGLPGFFFLLNDDARRHHNQQALGTPAVADVLEEAVDVRNLAQDRRSVLAPRLRQALQTAHHHRAAVRHRYRGRDVDLIDYRLLNQLGEDHLSARFLVVALREDRHYHGEGAHDARHQVRQRNAALRVLLLAQ